MTQHKLEATGNAKKIAKEQKREAKNKNRVNSDYLIYRIDENGSYLPEDFVMMQNITSYDKEEKDGKLVHKMKMSYQNIRNFEKAHKIPALTPNIQKKFNELFKADSGD